jgi:nickel/cobalt transporter (NiCoT) family protein
VLVAVANLATFLRAARLRRALQRDPALEIPPGALTPRGPVARVMTAPLRRVRHPRHIYLIGFLFSLGFDTSSQVGLVMVTAAAALGGAPALALLCLPFLFTAAMTLGDTTNGLMMLRMYQAAAEEPARKLTYNLVITGVSIVSALAVGVLALAALLTDLSCVRLGLLERLAGTNTDDAGYLLAALFALIGISCYLLWRRRPRA